MKLSKSVLEFENAKNLIYGGVKRMNILGDIHMYPLYFERAKGAYTWDIDGNKYIDYISGKGSIILGYSNNTVNNAVKKQIDHSNMFSLNSNIQNVLARKIKETIKAADRVRFFRTGSCAASALIRLARAYTEKEIILSSGYHGWHDTFMVNRAGVPKLNEKNMISFNYSVDTLKELLEVYKNKVAAIFITPEPCFFDKDFYYSCYDLAQKYKVLFLLDEVKSGFRIDLGGYQHILEITPDGSCFSKAISNGYPISVVVGKYDLMSMEEKTHLSGTFDTETSSMSAAIETINILTNNHVNDFLRNNGIYFAKKLNELFMKYDFPALCLYNDPTAFHIVFKNDDLSEQFYYNCANRGVIFYCNNNVMLNYAHTIELIDNTIDICEDAILDLKNYSHGMVEKDDIYSYMHRRKICV